MHLASFIILVLSFLKPTFGLKYTGYNLVLYPETYIKHNFLTINFGIVWSVLRNNQNDAINYSIGSKSNKKKDSLEAKMNFISNAKNEINGIKMNSSRTKVDEASVMKYLISQNARNIKIQEKLEAKLEGTKKFYRKRVADYKLETKIPAHCSNKMNIMIYFKDMNKRKQNLLRQSTKATGVNIVLKKETAIMTFAYKSNLEKTKKIELMVENLSDKLLQFKLNQENFKTFSKVSFTESSHMEDIKREYFKKQAIHNELLQLFKKKKSGGTQTDDGVSNKAKEITRDGNGDIEISKTHLIRPSEVKRKVQDHQTDMGKFRNKFNH
jgi:hypothetical protein